MINIIVAVGNHVELKGWPMGRNGAMPWNNKADLKWFKDTTTGHPVIMGRKTYEAIGHPLKNRTNIVVTTRDDLWVENSGIRVYNNLEDAIKFAKSIDEEVFIIGGASIYDYALSHDLVDRVYVDILAEDVPDADTFFPDIITNPDWEEVGRPVEIENRKAYAMEYVKIRGKNNHVDEQYLGLVNRIIKEGVEKDTRAGKTRSLFGVQLRFKLWRGLPMLTTKKMFAKGVIHELLWFLSGDTNIKYLVDNGVHIWDDDAYRYFIQTICKKPGAGDAMDKEEFLKHVLIGDAWHFFADKSYRFGDLGPVYGHQWRDWGGVDQVKEVIEKLCHYCCQFYTSKMTFDERMVWHDNKYGQVDYVVTEEKMDGLGVPTRKLSCMWNQRSVDCGLGLSFNILSYAILTHMVAQCVNMVPDELIFNGGDVHVYENHIEPLKEQLTRNPHMYALPTLKLNPSITEMDDFTYEDIKIEGYKSYPTIKMPLSVGL